MPSSGNFRTPKEKEFGRGFWASTLFQLGSLHLRLRDIGYLANCNMYWVFKKVTCYVTFTILRSKMVTMFLNGIRDNIITCILKDAKTFSELIKDFLFSSKINWQVLFAL